MNVSKPTYSILLEALYAKLRELSPESQEDLVHKKALSAWLAEGRTDLKNLQNLTEEESVAALEAYYAKKPRRKAGRPKNLLPRSRAVKAALTNHLVELGLKNAPDPALLTETLAKKILSTLR